MKLLQCLISTSVSHKKITKHVQVVNFWGCIWPYRTWELSNKSNVHKLRIQEYLTFRNFCMLANVSYSFEFYAFISKKAPLRSKEFIELLRDSLRFVINSASVYTCKRQTPTKYPKTKQTFNGLFFVFWSCGGYLFFADVWRSAIDKKRK